MSCCLYKHRSRLIDVSITIESIELVFILVFPYLSTFLLFFHQLDLLAATSTPWVAMLHASPPSRCHMARGGVPRRSKAAPPSVLTKLDPPVCQNRVSGFCNFEQGLPVSIPFVWQHILATLLGNQLLQARQS
jgi:hypothetical protein